jgi:hypothetical protein
MKLALALTAIVTLGLPLSGQSSAPDNSIGNLSERATSVIIVSISEAAQRGSNSIDVNDLIIALIIEDQEPNADVLFDPTAPGVLFPPDLQLPVERFRKPFLPPRVAIDVLVKLNGILPRSKSLPHGTELQTSAALERVYATAKDMPAAFNQSEVRVHADMIQAVVPLDLLAAALREPCEGTKMLQEAGITEEKVLQAIRAGGDLENGSSSQASR